MTVYESIQNHLDQFQIIPFKKGDVIYRAGSSPKSIYIIENGLLGLFHISENGKETFLRVFGKHQILGHRSLLASEPYHANALCLQDSQIYQISIEDFKRILEADPKIIYSISEKLAKDLKFSELRFSDMNDKSSYIRVVESIIYLKNKNPEQTWSRQEIAEFAVCTNETVTRTITKLEKMNLLRKDGRNFTILDQEGMLALSNENF